jgi:hypothetical protein
MQRLFEREEVRAPRLGREDTSAARSEGRLNFTMCYDRSSIAPPSRDRSCRLLLRAASRHEAIDQNMNGSPI